MTIKENAKDLVTMVAVPIILFGAVNGIGTLVPSKFDIFGGKYNRPCAAFRTNKVRKIALDEQNKLFRETYDAVKQAIYK